MTDQLLPS